MDKHENSPPLPASTQGQPSPSQTARLNDHLIAERISTLLSHYWASDDSPELRRLQMGDWLKDLGEFPASFVATAVQDWRQCADAAKRRPMPIDIRLRCIAIQREKGSGPKTAAPQITNAHREPKPAENVVRPHFRGLTRHEMTVAELEIFKAEGAAGWERVKSAAANAVKPIPARKSDLAPPRAIGSIITAPLPGDDDPRVQEWLQAMGES